MRTRAAPPFQFGTSTRMPSGSRSTGASVRRRTGACIPGTTVRRTTRFVPGWTRRVTSARSERRDPLLRPASAPLTQAWTREAPERSSTTRRPAGTDSRSNRLRYQTGRVEAGSSLEISAPLWGTLTVDQAESSKSRRSGPESPSRWKRHAPASEMSCPAACSCCLAPANAATRRTQSRTGCLMSRFVGIVAEVA